MKQFFPFLLIVALISFQPKAYTQDSTLLVIYKMGSYIGLDSMIKLVDKSPAKNTIANMLKTKEKLEAELYCTQSVSSFVLKDILIPEGQEMNYKLASILLVQQGDSYYTSLKTKKKIHNETFNNVKYNVTIPFDKYQWTIDKTQSKMVAGYKCYKATCTWQEYSIRKQTTVTFHPTVWFTYDIPYNFGPKDFSGLPGLILEATEGGNQNIYASEIKKNVKINAKKLVEPSDKPISYDDFVKLTGEEIMHRIK